jgi:hypothetical protein
MPDFDWRSFLRGYAEELLVDDEIRESLPEEVVESGWLGYPAATAVDLEGLEVRLGIALPPSYRDFLATTDGWRTTGWGSIRLLSTDDVGWLRDIDAETIEIWTSIDAPDIPDDLYFVYDDRQDSTNIRRDYFRDMLVVSSRDWANQDQLWLNPRVVFEDGEWEAWHFSTEYPGASRHRSFRELIEHERRMERSIKGSFYEGVDVNPQD